MKGCTDLGQRRRKDEDVLAKLIQIVLQEHDIETAVWGVTSWGEGPFGDAAGLWEPIFNALQARRRNEKQRKRKRDSDCADAVIAETAILNDCVLLTDDQDLFAVMPTLGGQVMNP